jgi:hypothetical protein
MACVIAFSESFCDYEPSEPCAYVCLNPSEPCAYVL